MVTTCIKARLKKKNKKKKSARNNICLSVLQFIIPPPPPPPKKLACNIEHAEANGSTARNRSVIDWKEKTDHRGLFYLCNDQRMLVQASVSMGV